MSKLTQEEILSYLEEATILELNELVKAIEEKFGVSAAAPVAVAAAAADAPASGPTSASVYLAAIGDSKVAVIKAVGEITGLGLVKAKGLVDQVPALIKENVPMEEAEEIKKKLMDVGASVEFK